jgi:hypothetical protein
VAVRRHAGYSANRPNRAPRSRKRPAGRPAFPHTGARRAGSVKPIAQELARTGVSPCGSRTRRSSRALRAVSSSWATIWAERDVMGEIPQSFRSEPTFGKALEPGKGAGRRPASRSTPAIEKPRRRGSPLGAQTARSFPRTGPVRVKEGLPGRRCADRRAGDGGHAIRGAGRPLRDGAGLA